MAASFSGSLRIVPWGVGHCGRTRPRAAAWVEARLGKPRAAVLGQ